MFKSQRVQETQDEQGIYVISAHEGRPNAQSIEDYGRKATAEKPWELRLRWGTSGKPFSFFVTEVGPIEGSEVPLKGFTTIKMTRPAVVRWDLNSGDGFLRR